MPHFITYYCAGGHTYGEYIEADDLAHAQALALARGLGERIGGEPEKRALPNLLARHIKRGEWLKAAHAATQLCFIGMSAGTLSIRDCIADSGLVHELLHLALDTDADEPKDRKVRIKHVTAMAREFEWRVPGWSPSFTGMPGVTVRIGEVIDPAATKGYANG